MAIKFLHNISLENLELKNAKLDVVSSDPTYVGADYEGRVIYNSSDNAIKFHNGSSSNGSQWVTLDGSGDISSVTVNAGTGLEVEAGSASATSGAFSVTLGLTDISGVSGTHGSATAIPAITVDGQGRITGVTTNSVASYSGWSITDGSNTPQAIASGNTLTVSKTDEIEVTVSATDTLTIGHADVSRSNTTSSASPAYGATFTAIDSITSNARGHITGVNTKTVTVPASDNTTYDLKVAAGGANTAVLQLDASSGDDDAVTFTGDDDAITITETTTEGSEAITFTLKDTIGGARTFSGNITINGNLTVSGSQTTKTSEVTLIEDNIITLNSNETGTPSENAGILVERGTATNVSLEWIESADRWKFTNDGSTYYNIPITGEYNPTIGTDTDITTSGATVIDDITLTDGVITAATTRTLTLADLGGADNYVGWNLKLDGSNTSGGASVASTEAVEFLSTTSENGGVTITNPSANQLEFNVVQGTTTKRGALELATNTEATTGTDTARAVTPAGLKAHVDTAIAATGFAVDLDAGESSVTKSSNTYTVTHGLASFDVIVQVVDISAGTPTYDTVHVDITRPTNGTVEVAFASSVTDDDYRVLIQKVM
jgi:hypothetical protein|tara:strand:- start:1956 stop:3773 length:1818 start_codon:yes stop_codon:yes gene_type:complete